MRAPSLDAEFLLPEDSDVSCGGGRAGPPEPFQAGVPAGGGRDGLSAGCISAVGQRRGAVGGEPGGGVGQGLLPE